MRPLKERFLFYYRWFLRNIYPSMNAAYYFAILAFNLAYLFDGSKYHSPFMWLIGTRVRRMGPADSPCDRRAELSPSPAPRRAAPRSSRPGASVHGCSAPCR